ncbi:MAG: HAMP domain-containing histidine kinase, partial [Deltaproteobacteria bacterium]|nr:HAMP domain-containing histidine kinase [Deltaproteobacteria bacterium]
MRRRTIIIFWLLLLLPTLIVGGAGFYLLRNEQRRITQEVRFSAQERANAISDHLQLTVEAVEERLTDGLKSIPLSNLEEMLSSWEKRNPLVRNSFIWNQNTGLQKPKPGSFATLEEKRFMLRYDSLISGKTSWVASAVKEEQTIQGNSQGRRQTKTARQKLVEIASQTAREYQGSKNDLKNDSSDRSGWIPWFAENSLYIIGWVQKPKGLVYGVELEVMTLLSRLITDFPLSASIPEGMIFVLVDGNGKILHQAGKNGYKPGIRPDIAVSLAPYLPHWQVAVHFTDGNIMTRAERGFIMLSGLLLAIFIVAIVLGGSLLMWQAHSNLKDAIQKTSFVSGVSHELKTPLTSIRMYAELLSAGRIKTEKKKKEYLKIIVTESRRLTRLVNNVLDFSRLEQGRKNYHFEELDITVFLYETIKAQSLRIKNAGLMFKEDIPNENIIVKTDRDALEQVMLNLLDNAIKYASEGEILKIALKVRKEYCELQFEDRGPGVPPAH